MGAAGDNVLTVIIQVSNVNQHGENSAKELSMRLTRYHSQMGVLLFFGLILRILSYVVLFHSDHI